MRTALKRAFATALIGARRGHDLPDSELETLHLAPTTPHHNDSLYLFGRDPDGTAIATRLSVRTDQPSEVWFSLRLPGRPMAAVHPMHHPAGDGMTAGGLRWTRLHTGKHWRVEYRGPLQQGDRTVECDARLDFHAQGPLVDFGAGVLPSRLSHALAAEPWSRRFFARLGEIRTVHYEQMGRLQGTITLDGHAHAIDVLSMRDHSFGRRRWSNWQRHCWLSGICEDGRAFTVTRIRYDFLGPLVAGFLLADPDGPPGPDGPAVVPIDETSAFDALGPPGQIPRTAALTLTDRQGRRHELSMETDEVFAFEMDGGVYALHEAITTFVLDGVPAVGIAELGWIR